MSGKPFLVNPAEEELVPPMSSDQELGSVEKQKSVIMHVLSQLKQGKDLSRVRPLHFLLFGLSF